MLSAEARVDQKRLTTGYLAKSDWPKLTMGAGQLSGFVDLTLDRFRWPLGKENLNDLQFSGKMDFEDLNWEQSYSRWPAYGRSKLANLLFTYELQRRLAAATAPTVALAAHPGGSDTSPRLSRLRRRLSLPFKADEMEELLESGKLTGLEAASADLHRWTPLERLRREKQAMAQRREALSTEKAAR